MAKKYRIPKGYRIREDDFKQAVCKQFAKEAFDLKSYENREKERLEFEDQMEYIRSQLEIMTIYSKIGGNKMGEIFMRSKFVQRAIIKISINFHENSNDGSVGPPRLYPPEHQFPNEKKEGKINGI